MTWTPAVIAHVNASPDFDPTGILILSPANDPERPDRVHPDRAVHREADTITGDVGLIGVLPEWRGRGLGRELLRWGVAELRRRGAGLVELSVEAANERATTLYRAHGFEPAIEWPHWVLADELSDQPEPGERVAVQRGAGLSATASRRCVPASARRPSCLRL